MNRHVQLVALLLRDILTVMDIHTYYPNEAVSHRPLAPVQAPCIDQPVCRTADLRVACSNTKFAVHVCPRLCGTCAVSHRPLAPVQAPCIDQPVCRTADLRAACSNTKFAVHVCPRLCGTCGLKGTQCIDRKTDVCIIAPLCGISTICARTCGLCHG